MSKLTYSESGVDIKKGEKTVNNIKKEVQSTFIPGVLNGIGGFSGMFELGKYNNPVLVSGTDGVGTKLKIAIKSKKFDTVGIDLVAMCVNDILVNGAKPLFFLDYVATGFLDENNFEQIIKGVAEGCRQAQCALIGGETAEMPGMYKEHDFDLAGFTVGVVEKDNIIDGKDIKDGDIVLGLESTGIHSNGFSLVRKLFFERLNMKIDSYIPELNSKVEDILLTPTKIYVREVLELLEKVKIKGMAHITGGGLCDNIKRVIPDNVCIDLFSDNIPELPIFEFMKKHIELSEMYKVFNMGIGFVIIVSPEHSKMLIDKYKMHNIGIVKSGKRKVTIV